MNRFTELLAVLESDASNRSISVSGKRRETIVDALRIAANDAGNQGAASTQLPAIPHATDNEKRIVGKLVTDLLAAGACLSVNGDTTVDKSTDEAAILAALSSSDEDYLIIEIPGRPRQQWVRLVWGNDVDVISDYHVSLGPHIAGANALANELDR